VRRYWHYGLVLLIVAVTITRDATESVLRAQGIPPAVVSQSPSSGAANVSTRTTVRATFSKPVQPASLGFELRTAGGALVASVVTYDAALNIATLTPSAELGGNASYTARVTSATDLEGTPLPSPIAWTFTTAAPRFIERTVFSGLTNPTAIEFASDGRVFVAEKSGLIKVFDNLTDTTPTVFADLRTNVHNFWDRGLLGLALHPNFPAVPYVYVMYAHDAAVGALAPLWGTAGATSDNCPTPPGATADGCAISGRISRLEASGNVMTGPEVVLVEDWFQQYPSHSIGSLAFGADGALYATGGDGASFNFADYGQDGNPLNPGGDPPVGLGGTQTPPTAEGGALRSQDLRTDGDAVSLDGTLIRIDPMTGAGLPNNPLAASIDPNARRVVAYGLRNPYRMTVRPGTNQVYIGDVGWNIWEEINRVIDPTAGLVNFGWPCYEGAGRQSGYDSINLNLCELLYAQAGAVTAPLYTYNHSSTVVAGEACPTGSSSISGLAFYQGTAYPANYADALFFSDYSRNCIWVMFKDGSGNPDPATRQTFKSAAAGPVQLKLGPDGNIYYVSLSGTIRRFEYFPGNLPPTAIAVATPTEGDAPLSVSFNGTGSSDPDAGDTLTYSWDFNGDGTTDATGATGTYVYTAPGTHTARLTVSDPSGLSHAAVVTITVDSSAPSAVITSPSAATLWRVGDTITFAGSATDREEGTLPPSALNWSVVMNHCSALGSCHVHPLQDFLGVAGGSFVAPDHEYPSYLELRLTATDGSGLQSSVTRRLDPVTVQLTFATSPTGLQIGVGSETSVAPFARTVIVGSSNSISASSPQTIGTTSYQFQSWSDGGAQTHTIVAPATATTYTATFTAPPPPTPPVPTGLTATTTGARRINVSWSNVSGESGYRVERATGSGSFSQIASTAANVVTYTDTTAAAATTYTYRVRSYNASGNSAPSSTAQATTLPTVIRINFQPSGSSVPSGYLVDSGSSYGNRGNGFSYGWNSTNNNTRDRNSSRSPDQRYDTLNHMQRNGTFSWSLSLPNGSYSVRVVAGDADSTDSYYRINVESTLTINQRPTSSSRWVDRTVTVSVSDGRLNVSNASSASNNKINFIEITPQQ
jgi:glucose/arabinose dehydrogenase